MDVRTRHILAGLAITAISVQAIAVETGARLYGDLRYAAGYSKLEDGASDTDFNSTNSHLGLAVTATEADYTLTAVYERAVDAGNSRAAGNDDTRQVYLSVGSPYGVLAAGQIETAYKQAGQRLDPFYNTGIGTITGTPFGNAGAPVLGPGFGLSALTSDTVDQGFVRNQVAYVSPTWRNLTANAAVMFADNDRDNGGQTDVGLGLEYAADQLVAGVQYLDIRATTAATPEANFNAGLPDATRATRVYGAWQADGWSVGASWEPLEIDGAPNRDYYFVSGTLQVSERLRAAASLGYVENVPFEGQSLSLGGFYSVFDGLEVYVAGRYSDRDVDAILGNGFAVANGPSVSEVVLGATYHFSLERLF
jgi:predicted porin